MNGHLRQRPLCAKASVCAKASGPEMDTVCSKLGEAQVAGGPWWPGRISGCQDMKQEGKAGPDYGKLEY